MANQGQDLITKQKRLQNCNATVLLLAVKRSIFERLF